MHGGMSPSALVTANPHAASARKRRPQRFSIDWLARALRHSELANLVVRQSKARRRLDDLAFFGGWRMPPAWGFFY
jgi:hypothetical protein